MYLKDVNIKFFKKTSKNWKEYDNKMNLFGSSMKGFVTSLVKKKIDRWNHQRAQNYIGHI